jgi:hypothetical protein
MWGILGLLLLIAYQKSGARMDTTLPAAWMGFVNPLLIVLISLRYGELTWTRLDTWCSIIFVATIVGWLTLDNPLVGLLGGIVADLVSAIPQIKKNWMEPHDEAWCPWTLFCIGSAVNFLAIEKWEFAQWLYPAYFTLGSASIAVPVILHRLGHYKNGPSHGLT